MADNNNDLVGKLPETPDPALKTLEPLIGSWKITGPDVDGEVSYEWMEGGFFMIQRYHIRQGGGTYKGVEYTGFDENTQTLRSRLFGTGGSNFTYTYEIDGDTFWYRFGDKNSDIYSRSTFGADGISYSGRWYIPEGDGKIGGYEFKAVRVQE